MLAVTATQEAFDPLVWKLPVKHLSASSLAMAAECPERWRRRYILKQREPANANLVLGSAVHGTLERYYAAQIQKQDVQNVDDLYDLAWQQAVKKQDVEWGDVVVGFVKDQGAKLSRLYLERVAPRVQPIAVEQRIYVRVDGLPVPLLGFIDLIAENGMVDYKTSAKKKTQASPSWLTQARIYQIAKPLNFSWHVLVKTKEPQIFTPLEAAGLWSPFSELAVRSVKTYVRNLGWTLNYLYQTLGDDNPWPTTGVVAEGACKRCIFREDCPAWRS